MAAKKIFKWIAGIMLVVIYAGFFTWQQRAGLGALLVIAVTCGWGWIFYKVTGINIASFSNEKEK